MFDETDRAEMVDDLGEPAQLHDGSTIYIIPDEYNKVFTTVDSLGYPGCAYPNVLIAQEDVDRHGIVDGEDGTVITLLGRQSSRITSYNVCYTKLLRGQLS